MNYNSNENFDSDKMDQINELRVQAQAQNIGCLMRKILCSDNYWTDTTLNNGKPR